MLMVVIGGGCWWLLPVIAGGGCGWRRVAELRWCDADAGALFVKVNRLDGSAALFARITSFSGGTEWQRSSGEDWLPDTDIEKRLESEIKFDPDVWIVEVENPGGENPFEELT